MKCMMLDNFLDYIDTDTKITLCVGGKKLEFFAYKIGCLADIDKYMNYKVTYAKASGKNKIEIYARKR